MSATVEEWQPGGGTLAWWNIAGIVLVLLGLIVFGAIHAAAHGSSEGVLTGASLLLTIVITIGLMVAHELVHGLVIKALAGSPTYGAMMVGKVVPVFYCTAPGDRFTRAGFVAIALAPAVVLVPVSILLIAFVPYGGYVVVPAALHFGGCIGDFGMSVLIARRPPGTMIEDLKTGLRFHPPAAQPA